MQLYPRSSGKAPAGSNFNPTWKSAEASFQVPQNNSKLSLSSLSQYIIVRITCFLNNG